MNILLTGSNGFLGNHILKKIKIDHKVFTLNRSNSDYNFCLKNEIPVFQNYFDLVIHAAGKAHQVPKTVLESEDFYNTNTIGLSNLLKGISNTSYPKYFIFISSVSVYGLNAGILINEDHPLLATDPYGKSKILAEKLVIDWCIENDIKFTILRLPLLVGDNPPGNLGNMIDGLKKGRYFNINNGLARKSMVMAIDVANWIIQISEFGGIYNLTDGYHPNFSELSINLSNQLNKKKPLNIPLSLAKYISYFGDLLNKIGVNFPLDSKKLIKISSSYTFDDTKAKDTFRWNPTPVLKGFKLKKDVQ
jgi:nucleoside-diphosphate-sugar epimerase